MTYGGSVSGSLTTMTSYTLEAVGWHTTMYDVYLPTDPHDEYTPAVAQITLNHTNHQTGCAAVIYDVEYYDSGGHLAEESGYFTNCMYKPAMVRVSFAVLGWPGGEGFGDSWCMALANLFQFGTDAVIDATTPPPSDYYYGGDY